MNRYRTALENGLALARAGDLDAAAAVLAPVVADAYRDGERLWASLLTRNVALFLESAGHAEQAAEYCRRFLDVFGDDAAVLYALARTRSQLGDSEGAGHYRVRARDACLVTDNHALLDVIEKWESDGT